MAPQATWDSCEGRARRDAVATGEVRKPNNPVLVSRRALACPDPACITLVLLLWSSVLVPVATLQPLVSSPTTTVTARPHNDSRTFREQVLQGSLAPPAPSEAPQSWQVNEAGKARQDQPEGTLSTTAGTATSATVSPPRHVEGAAQHTGGRAPRSITGIRRVELHGPPLPDRRTLFVEVVVLADYSFYRHYGDTHATNRRVEQLLSVANKVLAGVGVVLVPEEVRVWDAGDHFTVTSNMRTNVDGLQRYRLSLLKRDPNLSNDHTILLTREQMRGRDTCGAPRGGMCRRRESVSFVKDEGATPSLAGVALAHQVGHSLGMQDDTDVADDACRCHTATCVMSSHFRNASTPALQWSSCSRKSLSSAMNTLALDCLRNVPTRRHLRSSCGDGVVNAGEQCDCGPEEFCDNPCCVAATCKLAVNASCASGSCCDTSTCRPKPPGAVCRAALMECDLPEFCSGHSEYCPADVTASDGTPCRGGQGHCHSGECGSHEGRCQQLWGASASAASPDCYSALNVRGSHSGNCGLEFGVYRRCRPEESLCGTLHCLASASPASLLLPEHLNASGRVGPHECHFIFGSEDYPAHHWLTPNGAPCGPGKMCINQRCEEIHESTQKCPGGCSGRGVCNSRGNCHCDAGYSPPDCSLSGLGGSEDSNVTYGPSDSTALIRSMWVLVVLLASLLAVMCCSWGCFKGWYKRKGRDHTSRVLPCCVVCLDTCCCPIMTKAVRWMLTVRTSPDKKELSKDVEVEEDVNEQMLYSVDVDIKGTSQTNSWGVANEKLVTEVVTITPKNSPDLRRKVKLPSESPDVHRKAHDNHQRPKYQQSISMDSGCISDTDDDDSSKRSSLQLSMSSLLNAFKKMGTKSRKPTPERDINQSRNLGSQKSIPLSRLVVDPLARQATPPPSQPRPPYSRSFSTDIVSTQRIRPGGTPPPPPLSALKLTKSEESLSLYSEVLPCRQNSPPTDSSSQVRVSPERHAHTAAVRDAAPFSGRKVPLRPPANKPLPSPPRASPPRLGSPSPPQVTSQRHHGGRLQASPTRLGSPSPPLVTSQRHNGGRSQATPSPPRGPPRPSLPSKTGPQARQSSPENAASQGSNTVMAMARKFDAA